MTRYFITATGTNVGKTLLTAGLCWQLKQQGRGVQALKPVISGYTAGDATSDSAILLESMNIPLSEEAVAAISPWRYHAPLSPHMAATREGHDIALPALLDFCHTQTADTLLVEGVGGVMVPLNSKGDTVLDWMTVLNWPVIMVCGNYLGAISHTLTALETLKQRGLKLQALVISESADGVEFAETAATLARHLPEQAGAASAPVLQLPRVTAAKPWQHLPPITMICNA